jgi:sugar phosphate isomerase/epimerase
MEVRNEATRAPIGIGSASYAIHARRAGRQFLDPSRFLSFCRDRGAAGIQVPLGVLDHSQARQVRRQSEQWEMYVEGSVGLPADKDDLERFRLELRCVRACGGTIARTVCHSGRRYEAFNSAESYRTFLDASRRSLQLAEPIARDERVRLAVENHKDRDARELADLLAEIGSEAIGATVDIGNDLALLMHPEETVRLLAPFAASTHLKDARLADSPNGFLLDDAPLGLGMIDVPALVHLLLHANPRLNLTLEMITRDPLLVPCLDDSYWETSNASGRQLAETLRLVRRENSVRLSQVGSLPPGRQISLEDENVRRCLDYSRAHLAGC